MKKNIIFLLAVLILAFTAFSSVSAQNKMYVTLGQYEQDNNISNGPEDIEWLVLAIRESNNEKWAFLVSKYVIDARPYNDTKTDVTWETSSIRKWLNSDFYNKAFSPSEKEQIIKFSIPNPDNPKYNTPGGNKTSDNAFLLSYEDVVKYFPEPSSRLCVGTPYANAKGDLHSNESGKVTENVKWATRTPGSKGYGVIFIESDHDGTFMMNGGAVDVIKGIRPALNIKWNN